MIPHPGSFCHVHGESSRNLRFHPLAEYCKLSTTMITNSLYRPCFRWVPAALGHAGPTRCLEGASSGGEKSSRPSGVSSTSRSATGMALAAAAAAAAAAEASRGKSSRPTSFSCRNFVKLERSAQIVIGLWTKLVSSPARSLTDDGHGGLGAGTHVLSAGYTKNVPRPRP